MISKMGFTGLNNGDKRLAKLNYRKFQHILNLGLYLIPATPVEKKGGLSKLNILRNVPATENITPSS